MNTKRIICIALLAAFFLLPGAKDAAAEDLWQPKAIAIGAGVGAALAVPRTQTQVPA